jgi:hypothetical protein
MKVESISRQQSNTGLGQVFLEEAGRVDTGCDGRIVAVPFEMDLRFLSRITW